MKTISKLPALMLMAVFIFGCAQSSKERKAANETISQADSVSVSISNPLSSSASKVSKDTSRKFIRTADIKFRVKDVRSATYRMEDIVAHFDGFVTYTNLNSTIDRRNLVQISRDWALETIYYTVNNDLIIRVPDKKLDTTLKTIAVLMDYLDFRIIKAEDIGLTLLSQKLEQNRLKAHEERVTKDIDKGMHKLSETSDAEEKLLDKQTQSDNAKINRMALMDQVAYSTIKINIYQREASKQEKLGADIPVEPYEPGFLLKLKEAIQMGWTGLENVFLIMLRIWWFWLVVIGLYVVYRKYWKRKDR